MLIFSLKYDLALKSFSIHDMQLVHQSRKSTRGRDFSLVALLNLCVINYIFDFGESATKTILPSLRSLYCHQIGYEVIQLLEDLDHPLDCLNFPLSKYVPFDDLIPYLNSLSHLKFLSLD